MTTLRLVTPPTAQAVTLAEAKAHLNVDFDDDDTLISAYIDAATRQLDYLNRTILPSGYALDLDRFGDEIILPRPPFTGVTSIAYLDAVGVSQSLAASVYEVKTDNLGHGILRLAFGEKWPALSGAKEPVTINFTAGYSVVPGPIKCAVLLMLGGLYEQRAEVTGAQAYRLPLGVDALLSTYRIWTSGAGVA